MKKFTYTINEAVAALGLGRTTIYKLIGEGELKPIKVGARTLLHADDIETFVQRLAA